MKSLLRDHMSATARTAAKRAKVHFEQPSWTLELLTLLCLVLTIGFAATYVELLVEVQRHATARGERDFWRELAVAPETNPAPSVRLVPQGNGFRCEHFKIRREWEQAVATECEFLASLLTLARTTP